MRLWVRFLHKMDTNITEDAGSSGAVLEAIKGGVSQKNAFGTCSGDISSVAVKRSELGSPLKIAVLMNLSPSFETLQLY